jgi:hypothetical protein
MRGREVGRELFLETLDRGKELEEVVVESALELALVRLALVALERGAALSAGHVAREEHVAAAEMIGS